MFLKSKNSEHICYYLGKKSVSVLNLETRCCSCRYFLAYSNCAHLYKALLLYDTQTSSSKFVFRPRKGTKSKPNIDQKVETLAPNSFLTQTQLSIFESLVESYKRIKY